MGKMEREGRERRGRRGGERGGLRGGEGGFSPFTSSAGRLKMVKPSKLRRYGLLEETERAILWYPGRGWRSQFNTGVGT